MAKFLPIKSSFLVGARYDPATRVGEVQFRNGTYRYEGVKPEIWENFEKTFQTKESSGSYFAKHISPLNGKKTG